MGAVTNLNGLTDAKFVCAGRELSFVIDNSGKLRAAHRTYATEFSVADVSVKFKSAVSHDDPYDGNCVCFVIDENDDLWRVEKPTPRLCPSRAFLFTDVTTKPELQLKKVGLKAKSISSSGSKIACVSPEGILYFWSTEVGLNSRGKLEKIKPAQIETSEEITQVAVGTDHLLALGISGTVYSSGKNTLGQLGRSPRLRPNSLRHLFEIDLSENVIQIATGGPHSVALAASGLVYVWGKDLTTQRIIKRPTCVDLLSDNQILIKSISLAEGCKYGAVNASTEPYTPYILALTEDNQVYAWGKDSMGKCGVVDATGIGFSFLVFFCRTAPLFWYYTCTYVNTPKMKTRYKRIC